MGVSISHPFGNRNVYNAVQAFLENGMLADFHTTLFTRLGGGRRWHSLAEGARIRHHSVLLEVARLTSTALPGVLNGRQNAWVDFVSQRFDRAVSRTHWPSGETVYCYEDSAHDTFKAAAKIGIRRIYELPTLHWREKQEIIERELASEPELEEFAVAAHETETKLVRKSLEVELADLVICPSSAARDSVLKHCPISPSVVVVPYGVAPPREHKTKSRSSTDVLKILFVGALVPHKGIHRLFRALSRMRSKRIHLTLAGYWLPSFRTWLDRRYAIEYDFVGKIPRDRVWDLYHQHHLLVLPSLYEGFGLVLLEAMASGLPVVAARRTAGADIVEEGKTGFLVEAEDDDALQSAFGEALTRQADLTEMGRCARIAARQYSWDNYRARLVATVAEQLAGRVGL